MESTLSSDEKIPTDKVYNFYCPRCDHPTDFKGNLISHLKSKKECKITPQNISKENISREAILEVLKAPEPKLPQRECPYCNKTIGKANYARHLKTCKENSTDKQDKEVSLDELVKQQADTIEVLTKRIEYLESSQVKIILNIKPEQSSDKKYKKKKISHTVRIKCWNVHVGELIPKIKCMCCYNIDITQHNFHCGHVIAESNGGTHKIANLLPVCNVCNSSMGSINMNDFKNMHGFDTN
jgi:hypothetical protein